MTTSGSGFPYSFEDADSFLSSLSADQIQSDWLTPENEEAPWGDFYGLESNAARNNIIQPVRNGADGNPPPLAPVVKSEQQTPEFPTPSGSYPSDNSPLATTSNSENGMPMDGEPFLHDVKKFSPSRISKPRKEKTSHNMIEKKYRTNINTKILELRDAVPSLRFSATTSGKMEELDGLAPASKVNKASILTKAKEYIEHLEQKNAALLAELAKVRSPAENSQFQYHQMPAPVPISSQMNGAPTGYSMPSMPSTQEFSPYPSPPQYHPQRNSYGNKLMVGGMTALLGSQFFDGNAGTDGFDYKGLSVLPLHKIFPLLSNNNEVFVKLAGVVRALLVIWGFYYLLSPFFHRKSDKEVATTQSMETEEDVSSFSLMSEICTLALVKMGLMRPMGLVKAQKEMSKCVEKQEKWFTCHMNTMINPAMFPPQERNVTKRALFLACLKMNLIAANTQLESVKSDTFSSFCFWNIILCKLFSQETGGFLCSLFGFNHQIKKDTLLILTQLKDVSLVKKSPLLQQIKLLFDKDINILSDVCLAEKLSDVLLPQDAKCLTEPSAELKELVAKSTDEHLNIVNLLRILKCNQVLDDSLTTHLEMLSADDSEQELSQQTYRALCVYRDLIPATCTEVATMWEVFSTLIAPDLNTMEKHLKQLTNVMGHKSLNGVDLENVTNVKKSYSPEKVSLLANCFALYFNRKGLQQQSRTFLKYRSPRKDNRLSLLDVVASLITFQAFVSQDADYNDKAVLERLLGSLRVAVSDDAKSPPSSGGLVGIGSEVKADICDYLVNMSVQLYS